MSKRVYSASELRAVKEVALSETPPPSLSALKFDLIAPLQSSLKLAGESNRTGSMFEAIRAAPTVNWGDEADNLSDHDDQEDGYEDYGEDPKDTLEEDLEPIDHIQNRWIPPSMRKRHGEEGSEEASFVVAKTKSILNKLTVERFHKLSSAIEQLVCDNEDSVEEIAHVVVLKARQESHFGSLYANLCVLISGSDVDIRTDHTASRSLFKRSLLNKCQEEIHKVPEDLAQPADGEDERPTEDEENDVDALDDKSLERKHFFGLVSFVGHLHRTGFASGFIVHSMLLQFLTGTPFKYGSIRPVLLESICQLVAIVGKCLDGDGVDSDDFPSDVAEKRYNFHKRWLEFYFSIFESIIAQHEQIKSGERIAPEGANLLESRIVFSLRNLLELRDGEWEPRRTSMTGKSLDQIKADRDAEEARRKAEYLSKKAALKEQAMHGRDFDDQGFETVAAGGRRARSEKVKQAKEIESRIKSAIARGRYNNKGKNQRNGQGGAGNNKPPRHGNKTQTHIKNHRGGNKGGGGTGDA